MIPQPLPVKSHNGPDNLVPNFTGGTSLAVSDSIAASGSHIVAIANRYTLSQVGVPGNEGYVGIADTSGTVSQTFGFTCSPTTNTCPGHADESLHDVTVTPNGRFAIVSGNGVIGVYFLPTVVELARWINHSEFPHMARVSGAWRRATIDSVEATNTRAVIVGKNLNGEPQDPLPGGVPNATDNAKWRVTVVQLTTGAPITRSSFQDTGPSPSRAHDVAITPNGSKALVSTRRDTLLFDLTVPRANAFVGAYATANDPLKYNGGGFDQPNAAIVSDSIAVTDTRAVVIGRSSGNVPRISVIDLATLPAVGGVQTFDLVESPALSYWIPVDVAIDDIGKYAIVRLMNANGATGGRLVAIDISSPVAIIAMDVQSSGLGSAWGYDSVEASFNDGFTAGENFLLPAGWAQVITLP